MYTLWNMRIKHSETVYDVIRVWLDSHVSLVLFVQSLHPLQNLPQPVLLHRTTGSQTRVTRQFSLEPNSVQNSATLRFDVIAGVDGPAWAELNTWTGTLTPVWRFGSNTVWRTATQREIPVNTGCFHTGLIRVTCWEQPVFRCQSCGSVRFVRLQPNRYTHSLIKHILKAFMWRLCFF